MRKNSAIGHSWDEIEREIFTPEEIAASDKRVARILRKIDARIARDAASRESSGQTANQNVAVAAKGA
ncbi:MAG: hypothetical protein IJS21_05455 [Deltaproteobacteria bacterium]|jgi:hypothetical protein|nr:hypothetical protein [Deltaproteobacteria bacterium]MCR5219451.1 hypothetical protein [bacterium]